jgi:hypothetical protein
MRAPHALRLADEAIVLDNSGHYPGAYAPCEGRPRLLDLRRHRRNGLGSSQIHSLTHK